jgi:hypothetical protein
VRKRECVCGCVGESEQDDRCLRWWRRDERLASVVTVEGLGATDEVGSAGFRVYGLGCRVGGATEKVESIVFSV